MTYVLTYEVNEYDQAGEYFEALFDKKPDVKTLANYFKGSGLHMGDAFEALAFIEHLREGGGRQEAEYQWYWLREVKPKDKE